jgi:hypothetical protein
MRPARASAKAVLPPLVGMCTVSMPAIALINSPDRWPIEPTPELA